MVQKCLLLSSLYDVLLSRDLWFCDQVCKIATHYLETFTISLVLRGWNSKNVIYDITMAYVEMAKTLQVYLMSI